MKYICRQAKGKTGVYKEIHTYCSSSTWHEQLVLQRNAKTLCPGACGLPATALCLSRSATARCDLAGGRSQNCSSNTGPRLGQTCTQREHPCKLSSCTSSPQIWRPACTSSSGKSATPPSRHEPGAAATAASRRPSRVPPCSTLPTPWSRPAWKISTTENQKGILFYLSRSSSKILVLLQHFFLLKFSYNIVYRVNYAFNT